MTLKEKIKENAGFQYVVEHLEILSSATRRMLNDTTMMHAPQAIDLELSKIEQLCAILTDSRHAKIVTEVRHAFMQLHDSSSTLQHIASHITLDEVELFEVKQLSFLSAQVRQGVAALGLSGQLSVPDLTEVFALLDPDHTGLPNFYLYDSYDPRLAPIRKEMKQCQQDPSEASRERLAALFAEHDKVQQEVRQRLSDRLHLHSDSLQAALHQMAYCDLLFAKAQQALDWHLCRPTLDANVTRYNGLFNPRLLHHNEQRGLRYQPVDIEIRPGVCFITGANMAGKTVLLKSIATAQMMAQFGMFVPAESATLHPVREVKLCIGDEQNEMNGLSSFASEILKISDTLKSSAAQQTLILIDEPARTTNPTEGKAIVQSLASLLDKRDSFTLITTHYSQLQLTCRRLRVKGFTETMADEALTAENINRFIDYSLVEDNSDEVPQEALRIATLLGCDQELIETAKKKLHGA